MTSMERISKYISEGMASLENPETDIQILRACMLAEADASNFYEQQAAKAKTSSVKKLLLDVAREEDVHLYEFKAMLERLYPGGIKDIEKQADKEVKEF